MEWRASLSTWDGLARLRPDLVISRVAQLRSQPLSILGRFGEDPGVELLALPGALVGPMGIYFDGHLLADDAHYLPPDWPTQDWPAYRARPDGSFVATGEVEREIDGQVLFVDSFGGLGNFSHFVRDTLPFGIIQSDLLAGGIEAPALLPTWRFAAQQDLADEYFGPHVHKDDAWTVVERLLVVRRRWFVDDAPQLDAGYRVPRRELWRIAQRWPGIQELQDRAPTGDPVYLWRDWEQFPAGIRVEDRSVANGSDIDGLLAAAGFRRIDPLQTPVHEVIEAVAAAPIVAGLHGAQMAHIAWANRSAVQLEIAARTEVNEHHRALADALGMPTVRVVADVGDRELGPTGIDLADFERIVGQLLDAVRSDDVATCRALALPVDEPTQEDGVQSEPEPVEFDGELTDRRPDEDPGAYVERVRWTSPTPREDLHTVVAVLGDSIDDLDLSGRLAFGGLVVDLRAGEYFAAARGALTDVDDNEWARVVLAEIARLEHRELDLVAAIDAEVPALAHLGDSLQLHWLSLAAKCDAQRLRAVSDAIVGAESWVRRVPELDLVEVIEPLHRDRIAEVIATQPRRTLEDSRVCVDYIVERMSGLRPFRSQSVGWIDYDTFDAAQVVAVVDAAIAAADAGRGFSCVRLGDGEGLALAGQRANIGGALGADENGDWNELDDDDYATFRHRLGSSLRGADFVGVPDLVQCMDGPDGCVDVVLGCIEHTVPENVVVPGGWDIAWALEVSGLADRLLERCTGMIGPVDPAAFVFRHPADEITWLRVPGELHMYGRRPSLAESHWAQAGSIIAHDFRPGQLWLVGAGMLGKIYCDAIKAAGAVAVDVGSLMDLWSGRQDTRGTLRYQPWVLAPYGPSSTP